MHYQNMIANLRDNICANKLKYRDTIIIGDNSSGKSELIKCVLKELDEAYFIDAVNRSFDINNVDRNCEIEKQATYSPMIRDVRLSEENFNLRDTFSYNIANKVESIYFNYEKKIQELMEEFLGIKFSIKQTEWGIVSIIDDNEVALSSGYQALIRIFLEIENYSNYVKNGIIVIDEIDEYLFARNSGYILTFLKKKYPLLNFIASTHSVDMVANTNDVNVILLKKEYYEIFDSNEFEAVSQVYNILSELMDTNCIATVSDKKKQIDSQLRVLLNNKMSGIWNQKWQSELEQIEKMDITKTQKLMIKQIKEW